MEQHEIRQRRKALGLSVKALAEYTGSSQQYISQLEAAYSETPKRAKRTAEEKIPTITNASAKKLAEIDAVLMRLEAAAKAAKQLLPPKKERSKAS